MMTQLPLIANTAATVGAAIAGLIVGAVAFLLIGRFVGVRMIADAKANSERILSEARGEAETIRKQIELDARNELAKRREEYDRELAESNKQIKAREDRLTKREDNLARQLDVLTTKEKHLDETEEKVHAREQAVAVKDAELDQLVTDNRQILETTRREQSEILENARNEQKQALLRITNLSEEEARRQALRLMEQEVEHEASQLIQRATERAEEEAREAAQKITLQAIQRYASEHTADGTVNAIPIPSDDMKGRVIGREGRNIRAFEKVTGVDVIVDDTPGVVVVSCFDPIRRAIAAESLQKLLDDGRIHPSRIEEVVEQIQEDMQQRIVRIGREASIEVNIQGLHPKMSEMMGRLHYRTSYGQNILRHSVEVSFLCQVIADELGLDGNIARRCGYLHDIGKAMDHEVEGGHPAIGMDFCKKLGETEAVLNAVAGHHNDIPATTPYTPIVMAADAISGARPGARRETLEKYVRRLEQLEEIATGMKGVKQAFAVQAGREVRVIVDPENVDDTTCHTIARDIARRVSEEMTFPGEIRVTVLREMRTVEYAR